MKAKGKSSRLEELSKIVKANSMMSNKRTLRAYFLVLEKQDGKDFTCIWIK